MAEGFLKGILGKPAIPATGMLGLWGTIKSKATGLVDKVTTPFKFIKYLAIGVIILLLYGRFKK